MATLLWGKFRLREAFGFTGKFRKILLCLAGKKHVR